MLSNGRSKGFNRSTRMQEITKQEQLILERKREIEERLKSNQKVSETRSGGPHAFLGSKPTAVKELKYPKYRSGLDDNPLNRFKNDGSFLEKFRKFQEVKERSKDEKPANPSTVLSSSPKMKQESPSSDDNNFKKSTKLKINLQNLNARIKTPAPQLDTEKIKSVSEDDTEVSSPEEKSIRFAIEKTAIAVAVNGPKAESFMKQSTSSDNCYNWLNDVESSDYKYFLRRVGELQSARKRAEDEQTQGDAPSPTDASNEVERKRPRKSRWSDAPAEPVVAAPAQDPNLVQYAIQVYGKTDLSTEQWKQLEDQRKMRVLFNMIEAKQRNQERLLNAAKVKYEYDSDEETEGGTWEHKKRMVEMVNTQKWAEALTENSKGKHHLGDFLPSEELEKFMTKWEALKDGDASLLYESDYQNFKLQSDNIGYKMLKKLGWSEGTSLGVNSDGITAPVNKNAAGFGNAGLGQHRPDELQMGDDEYDQYRKRMMLAYRFRPNPLVLALLGFSMSQPGLYKPSQGATCCFKLYGW